ncbi:MAG: hypothetical protein ACRDGG_04780 [Anaerolineae bacterium]
MNTWWRKWLRPFDRLRTRPWHMIGAVGLFYIGLTLARFDGDPLAFAVICPDPVKIAIGRCGYDGQFAYHIAIDPVGGAQFTDVPTYRYQRIIYPMLARVIGLGQAGLIPWALILVNLIALVAGTAILEVVLSESGASRWYALAYGLFAGIMMPIRLDLTEPLAYALALGGVLAVMRGQCRLSGALLALAALTKETTLLFVIGIVASGVLGSLATRYLDNRHQANRHLELPPTQTPPTRTPPTQMPSAQSSLTLRCAVEIGLIATVPFVVWQFVLRAQFGQFGIGSGGALGTPFEMIPLRGWWSLAPVSLGAFAIVSLIALPVAIVPALIGLRAALRDFVQRRFDAPPMLLFFNAIIVLFTPQSTFREPLGLVRLIAGLVAATLIYAASRQSRRGLNYALLWIFTLALALNESNL